ncbi:MAG: DUF5060 domain-containing protein [Opitutaceae bacterium]
MVESPGSAEHYIEFAVRASTTPTDTSSISPIMMRVVILRLAIGLLCFAPLGAWAQETVIHPYWAPKTWELRPDDITTIMGFRAELSGNLQVADRPTPTVVNDAFIRGFATEDDVMTWEVDAPDEAEYRVSLLYAGREEILAQSTLEVRSGDRIITEKVNVPNWDTRPLVQRHTLTQTLLLKKGVNQISLRLVDFQGTKEARDALNAIKNAKGKTTPFAVWSIELVRPDALVAIKERAQAMKADVQWMVDGKYGLFVHFSSTGQSSNGEFQQRVDSFDVDAFVEKVVEIGASWVCFTTAHGDHYWPGPSKTIDALQPGFTCERDLIRELIDALAQQDIRLMLYYNPNSGIEQLYGNTYGSDDEPDPSGYFNFLESHFREVSLRYGEDLATTAGYVDDCGWKLYQLDPPWERFARAIKAGNPNAPVGFSQNLFPNLSPFSDLVVSDGSGRVPEHQPAFLFEAGGQLEGQHPAAWFYMDGWSGRMRNGALVAKPKFSAKEYIEIFKQADEANMPITINLASNPYVTADAPIFNAACIDIMKQVRNAVKGDSATSFAGVIEGERNADGSFKKWHRIEVVLDGPHAEESSETFRNYRLDVTFTAPSGKEYKVPGFFDADGDAANTSATSGNRWKARFAGGEEGEWTYRVSFVTGVNVAADLSGGTKGTAPDGEMGRFRIGSQDKSAKDFRSKGKLEYVGEHYLRFADGDYFIKLGANSPEVLLEYGEFDGTPGHEEDIYTPNIADWKTGDPTWGDAKGKGIIGLINYLSSLGVNGHYFLCMNAYGDGQEAWPWTDADAIDIYDVSKLAQWEVLFTHFDRMGLMVHFQLSESENTNYLESRDGDGTFSNARKIFYRELVARFGHHMAITWNIGEENQAPGKDFHKPNTHAQRKAFASRIRELTVYNDHISVHNGPGGVFDNIFPQLVGFETITGPSLQTYLSKPKRKQIEVLSNHDEVRKWYDLSAQSGHPWVVAVDEPWFGKRPTGLVDILRKEVIWGAILAGGHMEFYAGKDDVKHIDYRSYEGCWKVMGHAATFMNANLAKEMSSLKPNDDLALGDDNWAMADEGTTYLLYLKNGGEAKVDLSGAVDQAFTVHWYDPRAGGDLIKGSPSFVTGGSESVSLGNPPNSIEEDWVVLLKAKSN